MHTSAKESKFKLTLIWIGTALIVHRIKVCFLAIIIGYALNLRIQDEGYNTTNQFIPLWYPFESQPYGQELHHETEIIDGPYFELYPVQPMSKWNEIHDSSDGDLEFLFNDSLKLNEYYSSVIVQKMVDVEVVFVDEDGTESNESFSVRLDEALFST